MTNSDALNAALANALSAALFTLAVEGSNPAPYRGPVQEALAQLADEDVDLDDPQDLAGMVYEAVFGATESDNAAQDAVDALANFLASASF
jgi:hypothetical protein